MIRATPGSRAGRLAIRRLALLVLIAASCREPRPAPVVIATTTSIENAGLLEAIRAAFFEETGVELDAFVVGSGRALRMGRQGLVDITMTHEARGERELVASGVVVAHRPLLENRFFLAGPPENPAGIRPGMTVLEAMRRIHDTRTRFVSRGDESGTHARELELWRMLGIDPAANPGYQPLGQGMSALLRSANELRACALVDEATFARLAPSLDLVPLATGGDGMRNVYTVALVRGRGGPPAPSAVLFYEWLASDAGRAALERFGAAHGGFSLPQK